jgi:hypothetical protein
MLGCRIGIALLLGLASAATLAREIRNAAFAESAIVELSGQRMGLAGLSAVERNYLSFYAVGLYVPKPNPDAQALARGTEPCRIALQWLAPSVSAEAARAYWLEEFTRSVGNAQALEHLNATVNRFVTAAGPAVKGDVLIVDYDPELGLALTRNGAPVGRFPGVEFARALIGIWFGDKAPSDRRQELLGQSETAATARAP